MSREGTAKFAADRRWGNFFSASAGWIISEEAFLSDIDWIEMLKIRGSFGETGNQNIPTSATDTAFSSKGAAGAGYNGLATYYYNSIGNSGCTWEKTQSYDAGIDFAFFKNRLNGSVAYYRQNISDMLLSASIPASAGTNSLSMYSNVGDMYNQGLEFSVSYDIFNTKKFSWNTNFNITTNKNKVTALNPELDATGSGMISGMCITKTGYSIGTYYMPVYAGIDPEDGHMLMYELAEDEDGNTYVSDTKVDANYANMSAGRIMQEGKTALPTYYGGWTNNFRYKQWDLGITLTFSGGNYINNSTLWGYTSYTDPLGSWLDNVWTEGCTITENTVPAFAVDFDTSVGINSALEKGDYLRLRDLTIGYTLPSDVLKRLKLANCRTYISMSNLATLTGFSGYDPEMTINTLSGSTFNKSTQPNAAVYMIGIDLGF